MRAILLAVSAAWAFPGGAAAESSGLAPATLIFSETHYSGAGVVLRRATIRQAWLADGSTAVETSTTEDGRTTVAIRIRDLAAGREIAAYPDLGVKVVEALPAGFGAHGPMNREACAEWVRFQGEQTDGDPFVRRRTEQGDTVETRYDPALGCAATDVRVRRDGRLARERRVVRRTAGANEALFEAGTGLRAVTRVAWAEAHVARYGRPPITADRQFLVALRRMDMLRPVAELDE